MHAKWTPTDGFEKLVTQINIGVMYAQYVDHPIPDQEMVDTFIMVIVGNQPILCYINCPMFGFQSLLSNVCYRIHKEII